MKSRQVVIAFSILAGLSSGLLAQTTISSDIHIVKGKKHSKAVSTVSGDILVGKGAELSASISTVSGDVEIGSAAHVGNISAVSGDISVGKGASTAGIETVSGDINIYEKCAIRGSIATVSGDVNCDSGTKMDNNIKTVSGDIELDDAILKGNIETVTGDISLFNGSTVAGDIIVNRQSDFVLFHDGVLKIIIDMHSVVNGSILVNEKDSNVVVYLANGGKVKGEIVNAEVRKQ
ncbi:MAG: DUF4097 family beta strand repeat protein [Candidatus Marinimicrobia bacterium]|nr:DUF4097 family beta strand repeat protein [Candidatus Neomarinimicrobiota bacterium]